MNSTAVESTTLATVAYDKARGLLLLQFRSGAMYQYFGVPAAVHEALLRARSKGSYFNRAIRGWFPYCRVWKRNADVAEQGLWAECRG
jgi:hypothetical protein